MKDDFQAILYAEGIVVFAIICIILSIAGVPS